MYLVAAIVLSSVAGCVVGLYVGQPSTSWHEVMTFHQTLYVWSRIHIEVSPMAYPVEGQVWTIFVYSVNVNSGSVSLSRLANASVQVFVKELGTSKTYNLTSDSYGVTEFSYLSGYTDVAFQAFNGSDYSEKLVVSTHYVSSTIVDGMLSIGVVMSALTGMIGFVTARKKWMKPVLTVLFISAFVVCVFVSIFAVYCTSLGTVWGYPENVFGGVVTISFLWYLVILGFVLFGAFVVIALISAVRLKVHR